MLLLDDYGSTIDPAKDEVAGLALARDVNCVVNAFSVETPLQQWEVSIVLAPGFTPAAGDEAASSRSQFLKSKMATPPRGSLASTAGMWVMNAPTGTGTGRRS